MTNQYTDNTPEESADSPVVELSPEERQLAAIRDALRSELGFIDRRSQSFSDRTSSEVRALHARLDSLATTGVALDELLSKVDAVYEATFNQEERDRRNSARKLAQLERQQNQPVQQQVTQQAPQADFERTFRYQVITDLVAHADTKGVSEADFQAAWNSGQLGDVGNITMTPEGIAEYKAAKRREIDNFARQRAARSRQRTSPATPSTNGSGPRNYNGVALDAVSDEDFTKNFADIAAAFVQSKRR